MTETTPEARRSVLLPMGHLAAFLFLSIAWILVIGVVSAVYALAIGADPTDTEGFLEALGAGGNGLLAAAQGLGLFAIATGLALLLPLGASGAVHIPTSVADLRAKLTRAFAVRGAAWPYLVAAGFGATTAGFLPGWFAQKLGELLPDYPSTIELIGRLVTESSGLGQGVMIAAVVLAAPVFEELVYRGYLWDMLERSLPTPLVWGLTSLLFAASHMDPIQSTALIPTALFFGWLRWVSGSIWPCILAHFVNNGLAVLAMLTLSDTGEGELDLLWAVLGAAFTVTACGAAWAFQRSRTSENG